MTAKEQKIAEIRERWDSENNPESALMNAPTDVRFLLSELDKRDECTKENPCRECLKMSVDGYKEIVRELEDENRKLREERDKLIEGLRWYADEDTHMIKRRSDGDYSPIVLDHGKRARDILKDIGGDGGRAKVCKRHADNSVMIYHQCAGCELEWFREELEQKQQEIEQYKQFEQQYNEFIKSWEKYQQGKEKMIEGLHNYMKELDRRYQKAYRNYDIDCDHHQLGMAEAYEVAERRLRDILKEIGVTVE